MSRGTRLFWRTLSGRRSSAFPRPLRRPDVAPRSEPLEPRILFATRVWDGGSAVDGNWTTPANWVDDVAPSVGDDLLFPGGAARTTNTNDFPGDARTRFNNITFAGSGYSVTGNRINLQGSVSTTHATGSTTFNVPLASASPPTFTATYAGTTLSLGGAVDNGGFPLTVTGTGNVQLGGVLSGNGGIVKNGPGTLTLSGNNTYGGVTRVNAGFLGVTGFGTPLGSTAGGTVVAAGATLQSSGITTIAEPLTISGFGVGGDVPGNTNAALTAGNGFTTWNGPITLAGDASIGTVFTGDLTVNTSPLDLAGHTLAVNSEGSATFNVPVGDTEGGGNLVVNRTRTGGTVTLTAANTYEGATEVDAGTLVLMDAVGPTLSAVASLATDMINIGPAGTFRIDNGAAGLNPNRLPDDTDIILTGGTLDYRGSSAADSSETVDMIVLSRGHSTIRSTQQSGATATPAARLNASVLARSAGATVEFSGPNLGTAANSVRFATAPVTVGNGGGILPYATFNLNDFASYNVALGVVPFTNYATSIAAAGPGDTVRLSGDETVPADRTINALLLTAEAQQATTARLDPGLTLALAAGALVSAGAGSTAVAPAAPGVVSTIAFGREGVITRNNPPTSSGLAVSAAMAGASGLTLSGPGALSLSPPAPDGNRYTGGTTLNSGPVTIVQNNSPFGGAAGGTLDFYGGSIGIDVFLGPITIPNPVALRDANPTFDGLPNLTFSGTVTLTGNSIVAVPGLPAVALTGRVTGPGRLILRGGSPGGGTLTLANPTNDYAGGTLVVNNGIFRPTLAVTSGSVLGPGPLQLHQGTLQAAAPLTIPNQVLLDNAEVAFAGSGPITLGALVTVNGISTVSTAVETRLGTGRFGAGAITKTGSGTLVLSGGNSHTGATTVTAGTLLVNGSQPGSPTGVTGGTLGGTGLAGPIATGPSGTVNPGNPATARGILTAPSANFSNGGKLVIEISGFSAAGVAYDRLDLGSGPLLAGGTSTLTLDLAGVSSAGTANGVVRYGSRLGVPPQFGQVSVVNNPAALPVQTEYNTAALNVFVGNAPPDRTAPTVMGAEFEYQTGRRLRFTFSEDVSSSVDPSDLTVHNLTTGQTLPAGDFTVSYNAATNTATFTHTPGRLPNGNYMASLSAAGVSDAAGNLLAAGHTLAFYYLAGDINRDRKVDTSDFTTLAANFGRPGRTYEQGDLDGNGTVDSNDFTILAANFGRMVPVPSPAAFASAQTATAALTAARHGRAAVTRSSAKAPTSRRSAPPKTPLQVRPRKPARQVL